MQPIGTPTLQVSLALHQRPPCTTQAPQSTRSTIIPTTTNLLIQRLPADDMRRLLAACEPVEWRLAEVVCEPGEPVQHAYFPLSGFLSLVTQLDTCPRLEVGLVGCEGMLGAELSLGVVHAPFHVLVQGAGTALRIDRDRLSSEMSRSATLQYALNRYTGVTLAQLATSATCLRLHSARERLARWMLMSQDRAQTHHFPVLDVFFDYMLGEARQSVTKAIAELQRLRLIERQGDAISVMDRTGLESAPAVVTRPSAFSTSANSGSEAHKAAHRRPARRSLLSAATDRSPAR